MRGVEVNFDGIVGPTHNYSGLSLGNIASVQNRKAISNPRKAALQGLQKMKFLSDLGCKQALLPPQERPHIPTLKLLGFTGSDEEIIKKAFQQHPEILFSCASASSMWTANAATVSPSSDSEDRKVHFSPANLTSKFHRSIEYPITTKILRKIFSNPNHFVVHDALLPGNYFSDEGAANHTRFCKNFGDAGVQLFVFGRYESVKKATSELYAARQTWEASKALARRHLLSDKNTVFAQQNPAAIDAGVFHNDVISVGHGTVFFYHELAFVNSEEVIKEIEKKFSEVCHSKINLIKASQKRISIEDAVASYLFNSQIITYENDKMMLIAPTECQEMPAVKKFIDEIIHDNSNPIDAAHYFNLHESMRNGGGPACLRLRVVLNEKELAAANPHVFMDNKLYDTLVQWVEKHYRDRLCPDDLADPNLLYEGRNALDKLTKILQIGNIYDFQK